MLLNLNHHVKRSNQTGAVLLAVALVAVVQLFLLAQAQAADLTGFLTPDLVQPLDSKQGYALFELDVSGVAPSMEFARLERRPSRKRGEKVGRARYGKSIAVDLKNLEKGLYLLPLSPGWYQIKAVNAPYFNLPYRMNTISQPQWRFEVHAGKTSYVGQLNIAQERRLSSVDIALRNRIATTLDDIEDQLASVLATAPLVMGRGMRDDFLSDLKSDEAAP